MPSKRIFIIDDLYETLDNSRMYVCKAAEGCGVDVAISTFQRGDEAREHWQNEKPDLVLLDLSMPEPSGIELLKWWNRIAELSETRVIVVSNLSGSRTEVEKLNATFWPKTPLDHRGFVRDVQIVLESLPAYRKPYAEHLVRLYLTPGSPTRIQIVGRVPDVDRSNENWVSKVADQNDEINTLFETPIWFNSLTKRGYELYKEMFVDQIADKFSQARSSATNPEHLRMRFVTDINTAVAGFELLRDRSPQLNGEFLVLRHPMATQIEGLNPTFAGIGRDKLNDVKHRRKTLRFLLVAANLEGTLLPRLHVDDEIRVLAHQIPEWFRAAGIPVEITTILSSEVTVERLREFAVGDSLDVLHFAGHAASYDYEQRHEAGLYVWQRAGNNREQYLLSLPELEDSLKRMRVGFVFLNCCRAGMQQDSLWLKRTRLLGLAHAVLKAGTESVLCYRSAVNDASASKFAMDFYKNLADYGEIDLALHATRRLAYKRDPKDSIWLAAIMFDQAIRA